jgi:hypothetical protein
LATISLTLTSVALCFLERFLHCLVQGDGNLVLYTTWSSGTQIANPSICVMQEDGNLMLYNRAGVAYWAIKTRGKGVAPHKLALQDSRLNIVDGTGRSIWTIGPLL